MANLLQRLGATKGPNGTVFYDNGEVDHTMELDHATGLRYSRPVAATEEEKRERYASDLRRELAGVEFQLEHLDDPPGSWVVDVPNAETVERTRRSLEGTAKAIHEELERLGEPMPKSKARTR